MSPFYTLVAIDTILVVGLALLAFGLHVRLSVLSEAHDRSNEIDDENTGRTVRNFRLVGEVFESHASRLREHEANIHNLIDIGNHNDDLIKKSFDMVGAKLVADRLDIAIAGTNIQQHERDIQDLITVQDGADTKVMDLRTEFRAFAAQSAEAQGEMARIMELQSEFNGALINQLTELEARFAEVRANLVMTGAIDELVGESNPREARYQHVEVSVDTGVPCDYAKEYEGSFEPLAPLVIHEMKECDPAVGLGFSHACADCLKANGLPDDPQNWIIRDDSITDFRMWRRFLETPMVHKLRIAKLIAAERPNTLQGSGPAFRTSEQIAADVYNRAFNTGPSCPDDVEGGPFRG